LGCFFGLGFESASGCGEKRLEMVKNGKKRLKKVKKGLLYSQCKKRHQSD
jgi:hypothetical protein